MITRKWIALWAICVGLMIAIGGHLQNAGAQSPRTTQNMSVSVTMGTVFQPILTVAQTRIQITIQNNNTSTDNCWIHVGTGTPTTSNSMLLTPSQAYTRYYPYIPSDAIQGTCTTSADTIYVDIQ